MLDPKLATILADFKAAGGSFGNCVEYFGIDSDTDAVASKAKELYQREGEVEIDSTTVLSESDEGAYVMAWVWVGNEDLES